MMHDDAYVYVTCMSLDIGSEGARGRERKKASEGEGGGREGGKGEGGRSNACLYTSSYVCMMRQLSLTCMGPGIRAGMCQ